MSDHPAPPTPRARREDRRRGVFVDGLSEWVVRSPREVYELMMRGAEQVGGFKAFAGSFSEGTACNGAASVNAVFSTPPPPHHHRHHTHPHHPSPSPQRATGATKMNEVSSRSHAVCIIIVEKCSGGAGSEAASPGAPPGCAACVRACVLL